MKLRDRFYKTFILGEPEAHNHDLIERYEAFSREFAGQPEAESLRIRYRIVLNVLIWSPHLLIIPAAFPQIDGARLFEWWMLWSGFVSLPVCLLLSLDQNYVRRAMKRRTRLAARSYPKVAEKLLWLFLPPETCEEAIDDFNCRFEKLKLLYGTGFARRWYCCQVVRSVWPALDLLIERTIKFGFWGWISSHL